MEAIFFLIKKICSLCNFTMMEEEIKKFERIKKNSRNFDVAITISDLKLSDLLVHETLQ